MVRIKLLFTCPHGGKKVGSEAIPPIAKRISNDFPESVCPSGEGQGFSDQNDKLTEELTNKIVENIQILSGKEPYKQLAVFNRDFIDYNRNPGCAYKVSSSSAKDSYDEYHNQISQKIIEMLPQDNNESEIAFLFDIHGTNEEQSPEPEGQAKYIEVLVGTDQLRSRQALTRLKPECFWGPNGLYETLKTRNIRMYPENEIEEEKPHPLDGGYTIKTYGSDPNRIRKGLVAIQIEVISCIRDNRYCRESFARDLADCILKFVEPFV
jgi:hypothetical protein